MFKKALAGVDPSPPSPPASSTSPSFSMPGRGGWHTEPGLAVPEGLRLLYLPPYTSQLQPAETLWAQVGEPIANRHFDTLADLDAAVAPQCSALHQDRDLLRGQAGFHWWPQRVVPT